MKHLLRRACLACALLALCLPTARGERSEEDDMAARVTTAQFPFELVPEPLRLKVETVIKQPTAYSRGPVEAFPCHPPVYRWLLDNPHHGFRAWKALGVKCATVDQKGDGSFHGVDPLGSEMKFTEVLREPNRRVWYAEGLAKPAPLTPSVPFKLVLLLRYHDVVGADGRIGVRQRAELFAQFDAGKAATFLGKVWGMTSDVAAKKAAEQVELFFSGLAWYISEHPDWVKTTLKPTKKTTPTEIEQVEGLIQLMVGAPSQKSATPRMQ